MSALIRPMTTTRASDDTISQRNDAPARRAGLPTSWRWAAVLAVFFGVLIVPRPDGVTVESWRLGAVFAATITGLMAQPVPGGLVVLLGIVSLPLVGAMPIQQSLAGYADPVVWMVLAAFFMSRGMIKTGLGRRIAFMFIRAIGQRSLGLGYALIATDVVLGSFIPSNGARAGGIIFPITKSLAQAYESEPGPTARRLGTFLMTLVYQGDVVVCALFLTGQASNPLIAKLAGEAAGYSLTYPGWFVGAIVPALVSFLAVPRLIYRLSPPDVKETPAARQVAIDELQRMGPPTRHEWIMVAVFLLVAALWMTAALHRSTTPRSPSSGSRRCC